MLFDLIQNPQSFTLINVCLRIAALILVLFLALPLHEFAHAFAAVQMGDNTPRWEGRYTLNPLRHIDPIGAVMIFLLGIGYAKPVPVNPLRFKRYRAGLLITALAGVTMNFLLSLTSLGILKIFLLIFPFATWMTWVYYFLAVFAYINLSLMVFNLLPIPPLDGYRVLSVFLPDKWRFIIMQYGQFISLGILVLFMTGFVSIQGIIDPLFDALINLFGL